jgi:hypothetical protein
MKKSSRILAIVLVALILAVATYAFAAANTMPASTNAGDGEVTISGYDVTNVHYVLNAGNIDTVTFTIAPAIPAGGTVSIQLTNVGTPPWYACTVTAGTSVSCDATTSPISVLNAVNLRVVAAQ